MKPMCVESLVKIACDGDLESIQRYIQGNPGIDINAVDKKGNTALTGAACSGHTAIIEYLLKEVPDIDVNAAGKDGYTALIYAALYGHIAVVQCLLKAPGITINATNSYGYTALTWAALNGHTAVVECLLKVPGIDCKIRDNSGHTALTLATWKGYTAIVTLLKDAISKRNQLLYCHTEEKENQLADRKFLAHDPENIKTPREKKIVRLAENLNRVPVAANRRYPAMEEKPSAPEISIIEADTVPLQNFLEKQKQVDSLSELVIDRDKKIQELESEKIELQQIIIGLNKQLQKSESEKIAREDKQDALAPPPYPASSVVFFPPVENEMEKMNQPAPEASRFKPFKSLI